MSDGNLQHIQPPHRVAITGIGLVTPFGIGREASWQRIVAGESATQRVDGMIGAPAPLVSSQNDLEPVTELAITCADEAVLDANLDLTRIEPASMGCVIGTSKPGLRTFDRWMSGSCSAADVWSQFQPNAAALAVAGRYQVAGPCLCPVAACATGLVCLQRGSELIRDGVCDIVLAGSSDASFIPILNGSFQRMRVLSREKDNPAKACRPFDTNRNGFVIGEGAAVIVMERLDKAQKRDTEIYAEWLGDGVASEPANLTSLGASGESLSRLIADVLKRANVTPAQIDYVNCHGTATRQNDVYETLALKRALGKEAHRVSCSSLKGGMGHLLGAAGSVETAATLLAMRDGLAPPTVNLETPDPECDLDYTARVAKSKPIRTALKLSLGFGGHLAAAVLRRP